MRALALFAALALSACGSDNDPGPGEVSVGEARQLNEAAQATDINAAAPADDAK